jgi:acetolactate synthase-1/2/3 large subunit
MLVVGSRLRGNETLKYELKLPRPLYRIDADGRPPRAAATAAMLFRLRRRGTGAGRPGRPARSRKATRSTRNSASPTCAPRDEQAVASWSTAWARTRAGRQLQAAAGRNFNWVRDVTVSNSTWGNRDLRIFDPLRRRARHSAAASARAWRWASAPPWEPPCTASGRKTFCLAGDGGFILNLGELATAVQEKADMVIVLMNDKGYGVIKNIQDAQYGGRRCYVDLHTPDYALLCKSLQLRHARVSAAWTSCRRRWTGRWRRRARSCWRSTCCPSAAFKTAFRRPADQP